MAPHWLRISITTTMNITRNDVAVRRRPRSRRRGPTPPADRNDHHAAWRETMMAALTLMALRADAPPGRGRVMAGIPLSAVSLAASSEYVQALDQSVLVNRLPRARV